MATHVASYDPRAGRVRRLGRLAAQLAGPIAFTAMVLAGASLVSAPANAETARPVCGERAAILKRLEQRHDETPQARGQSGPRAGREGQGAPHGGGPKQVP